MKTRHLFILIAVLLSGIAVRAQTVRHKLYTTYFNQATHEPDSVSWDLYPGLLSCTKHFARTNIFTADPELPNTSLDRDYKKSGHDRGHQMPAQDNTCDSTGQLECFYFSNMVPQTKELNEITWKALEEHCRSMSDTCVLHIICGPIGSLGTIGPDQVNIPAFCYKAVYKNGYWECYIMPNTHDVNQYNYTHYLVTTQELNPKTGLKL